MTRIELIAIVAFVSGVLSFLLPFVHVKPPTDIEIVSEADRRRIGATPGIPTSVSLDPSTVGASNQLTGLDLLRAPWNGLSLGSIYITGGSMNAVHVAFAASTLAAVLSLGSGIWSGLQVWSAIAGLGSTVAMLFFATGISRLFRFEFARFETTPAFGFALASAFLALGTALAAWHLFKRRSEHQSKTAD